MNFSSTTYYTALHPQKVDKGIQVDPPAEAGSQTTPEPPDHLDALSYIDVKAHHLLDGSTTLTCTSTDGHHCTGCIEFNKTRLLGSTTVTPIYATTTGGPASLSGNRTYITTSGGIAHVHTGHQAPQFCDVHGTIQAYRAGVPSPGSSEFNFVDNVAVTVTPVPASNQHAHQQHHNHHHHHIMASPVHHQQQHMMQPAVQIHAIPSPSSSQSQPQPHHHHHHHHQPAPQHHPHHHHQTPQPHHPQIQTVLASSTVPAHQHLAVPGPPSDTSMTVEFKPDPDFNKDLPTGSLLSAPLNSKVKKALKNMRPYVCETCDKTFYKEEHLVQHRRVHSGERPFKCNLCEKTFRQSGALHNHKQIHVGTKNFHCDICNKSFAHARNLKCHVRTHTGERPYQCDLCSKCFTQAQHLAQHKKLHAGQMHTCDECGQSFTHPSNLVRHKRIHANGGTPSANRRHASFEELGRSQRAAAVTIGDGSLIASEGSSPSSSSSIAAAAAAAAAAGQPLTNVTYQRVQVLDPDDPHGEPTSIVVATTAGSEEDSLDEDDDRKFFAASLSSSGGEETHMVEGKYFTTPDGVTIAASDAGSELSLAESVPKFYACDVCDKIFSQQSLLDQHRKSHENAMYACETCGKGFSQPRNLHRHQLIHTGERPFSCNTCGKSFNQSTHLSKHMKLHGMELPYTCRRCGERFRYKSERERHKKAFHPPNSPHDQAMGTLENDHEQQELDGMSQHSSVEQQFVDDNQDSLEDGLDEDADEDSDLRHHQVVVVTSDADGNTVYTTESGEIIHVRDMNLVTGDDVTISGERVEMEEDDDEDGTSPSNNGLGGSVLVTAASAAATTAETPSPTYAETAIVGPGGEVVLVDDGMTVAAMAEAGDELEMEEEEVVEEETGSNGEDGSGHGGEPDDSLGTQDGETIVEAQNDGETFIYHRSPRYKAIANEDRQTFLQSQ